VVREQVCFFKDDFFLGRWSLALKYHCSCDVTLALRRKGGKQRVVSVGSPSTLALCVFNGECRTKRFYRSTCLPEKEAQGSPLQCHAVPFKHRLLFLSLCDHLSHSSLRCLLGLQSSSSLPFSSFESAALLSVHSYTLSFLSSLRFPQSKGETFHTQAWEWWGKQCKWTE
jgi:hypothetical protein